MLNLHLIILAAGNSKRFGSNKLLYKINGIPMYEHAIDVIKRAESEEKLFSKKIVVTKYQEIINAFEKINDYDIALNYNSDTGQASSIRVGLEKSLSYESNRPDAWCFMVGDQPYLRHDTLRMFIKAWENQSKGIGSLYFEDRRGNPAIFSNAYTQELLNLTGDTGGRSIISNNKNDVFLYSVQNKKEFDDYIKKLVENFTLQTASYKY